jgi:hypothetical protein
MPTKPSPQQRAELDQLRAQYDKRIGHDLAEALPRPGIQHIVDVFIEHETGFRNRELELLGVQRDPETESTRWRRKREYVEFELNRSGWDRVLYCEAEAYRLLERREAQAGPVSGPQRARTATTTEAGKPAEETKRSQQREWLAEAMLAVRDHPDWSDAAIARKVGKDKSTLARSKEYRLAAALARGTKEDHLPKGHTTRDDSGRCDVEAVARPDPQPDDKTDRGQPISGSKYFREYCAECDEPIKVRRDQVGKNPVCDDCKN